MHIPLSPIPALAQSHLGPFPLSFSAQRFAALRGGRGWRTDAHDDVALVGVEFPEGFERDLHTLHVVWCTALVLCGARCRVLQGERCTLRDPFYTVARLHIGWLHVDA